jgi:SAM-dependent methyltransferase
VNVRQYNRAAWDKNVELGNRWTLPVSPEVVAAAREGDWQVILTPTRPVPESWFPDLAGLETLCLASGGGQQAPVLAAVGAKVTVFDNSPRQQAQDRAVASREGLPIDTVEGDMADLSVFADGRFGLVFHPISNCFVPDVRPVWREAFRVLRTGGILMAGFLNPVRFLFDDEKAEQGIFELRHSLPYSDLKSISDEERRRYTEKGEPLCFGHTFADQIGGQLAAGFVLTDMYEDADRSHPLTKHTPDSIATRAVKP